MKTVGVGPETRTEGPSLGVVAKNGSEGDVRGRLDALSGNRGEERPSKHVETAGDGPVMRTDDFPPLPICFTDAPRCPIGMYFQKLPEAQQGAICGSPNRARSPTNFYRLALGTKCYGIQDQRCGGSLSREGKELLCHFVIWYLLFVRARLRFQTSRV